MLTVICCQAQINLNNGLRAQYDFSGNANDITGNGFDGTVNGATLTDDRFGNPNSAYYFDHNLQQNIDVSGFQNMIPTDEISISVWVKVDTITTQAIVTLFPDDQTDRIYAEPYYDHNGISSTFWDYGDIGSNGRLGSVGTFFQSSVWEHYVYVASASQNMMQVYRNGYLQFFKTGSSTIVNRNRTLSIGGNIAGIGNANCFFGGTIDDMRIYNRVLNPAEIMSLYHGYYNTSVNDLRVFVTNWPNARPGFPEALNVVYQNVGTTTLNGYVELNYDPLYNFVQATPAQDSVNTHYLGWYVNNIAPGDQGVLHVELYLPSSVPLGTMLSNDASIYPITGDTTPGDNYSALRQIVVGGCDPNYIEVSDSIVSTDFVNNGDYLYYSIHFQNTGTAVTTNVRVEDQIAPNFTVSSVEVIGASHNQTFTLDNSNKLTFFFDNINLPDSATSFFGSNGFVMYKIKTLPTLQVGDQVSNNASIFFDFNQPVLTNTVVTNIVNPLSIQQPGSNTDNSNIVFPNPFSDFLNITRQENILSKIILYDITARKLFEKSFSGSLSLNTVQFSKGIYFYSIESLNGEVKKGKLIKQ
jgi:uncharacterized repeat protein (TIGR01451 family)